MRKFITVTPQKMQTLDHYAINTLGIPAVLLMERAAQATTVVVTTLLKQGLDVVRTCNKKNMWAWSLSPNQSLSGKQCLVLCGKGNNGGDGLAVARLLHQAGAHVNIALVAPSNHYSGIAAVMAQILVVMGHPFLTLKEITSGIINQADVIIDALYGTGFQGAIGEPLATLFSDINKIKSTVVAIDIPSGLDGTTGNIETGALRATVTVTMQCVKSGMVKGKGVEYCGEIVVADIGIPNKYCNNKGKKC